MDRSFLKFLEPVSLPVFSRGSVFVRSCLNIMSFYYIKVSFLTANADKYLLNVEIMNFRFPCNLLGAKHCAKVYSTQSEPLECSQFNGLLCLGPCGVYRESLGSTREQELGSEIALKRMIARLPSVYRCEQTLHVLGERFTTTSTE